jgi:hypothetical protein
MFVPVREDDSSLFVMEDESGSGWLVNVTIARCQETDREVSVVSYLQPMVYHHFDVWEFSFAISVVSIDDSGESFETQDRNIVKHYLLEAVRGSVMEIVCRSCILLLEHQKPAMVYRVTKGRGLNDKALAKHHLLTERCKACGYTIEQQGTDRANRLFWVMNRKTY